MYKLNFLAREREKVVVVKFQHTWKIKILIKDGNTRTKRENNPKHV